MKDHVGMPGIGGSLGQCAICGKNFLTEILLGTTVVPFEADGCEQTLYAHKACIAKFEGKTLDVLTLPETSPLRLAFERQKQEVA